MSIELIIALGGLAIAIVTFIIGRLTSATSVGQRQGDMESRLERAEEDIRTIHAICDSIPEKYISKSSFNEVVHRVDTGLRDLQTRLDSIYSLLLGKQDK